MPGPHAGNRNRPAYSGQARFRFPKQVIELFAPRKPIQFKPPPRRRKLKPMLGIASFIDKFSEANPLPSDQPSNTDRQNPPSPETSHKQETATFETPAQRRRRVQSQRRQRIASAVEKGREMWDPKRDDADKTNNAYNTLFVANVPFEAVEKRLQQEFAQFGPVVSVFMPKDHSGMPRGYAFVEFESESGLKHAYREGNGMRIDGRRVLVDVERGRTVDDWFPNRLDGPHNACVRKQKADDKSNRPRH